ncbi:uncharacterized protein LOC117771348 [Hippoglossus hippoglossus]|uniref:uncharacterized protein LOC117771348 n=1 Tax=Hippoglossus hippoglossus TaxID=8267 RepID=UPI00148D6FB2|nr:uncharacterized protein LOC117771348 [Hippoglossus hippoglossus]
MEELESSAETQAGGSRLKSFTIIVDGRKVSGRPKLVVSRDQLEDLIDMELSVPCISKMLGVSNQTVRRRMQQWGLAIKESCSKITDDELDGLVSAIKADSPNLGQKMVKERLKALGHRVQMSRVCESVHRVQNPGSRDRPTTLGCEPAPLSLVHVNTSHKLNRYGIILFGGIDGFSRKILYLQAANNNKPSTALTLFLEAVARHGLPSRVRGEKSVENTDIARLMYKVAGHGRGSFTSGSREQNERIDGVWRDVWNGVSSIYYDLLHSLEEDDLLDPEDPTHLFCALFVFLSRIQKDLDTFTEDWNDRLLHTEENLTDEQRQEPGESPNSVTAADDVKGAQFPDVEFTDMNETAEYVPEVESPLDIEELDRLHQLFNPTAPSLCFGADIYCAIVHYVHAVLESGQEAEDSDVPADT